MTQLHKKDQLNKSTNSDTSDRNKNRQKQRNSENVQTWKVAAIYIFEHTFYFDGLSLRKSTEKCCTGNIFAFPSACLNLTLLLTGTKLQNSQWPGLNPPKLLPFMQLRCHLSHE